MVIRPLSCPVMHLGPPSGGSARKSKARPCSGSSTRVCSGRPSGAAYRTAGAWHLELRASAARFAGSDRSGMVRLCRQAAQASVGAPPAPASCRRHTRHWRRTAGAAPARPAAARLRPSGSRAESVVDLRQEAKAMAAALAVGVLEIQHLVAVLAAEEFHAGGLRDAPGGRSRASAGRARTPLGFAGAKGCCCGGPTCWRRPAGPPRWRCRGTSRRPR